MRLIFEEIGQAAAFSSKYVQIKMQKMRKIDVDTMDIW